MENDPINAIDSNNDTSSLPAGHVLHPQSNEPERTRVSGTKSVSIVLIALVACIAILAFIKSNWSDQATINNTPVAATAERTLPLEPAPISQTTTTPADDKSGDWYVIENHSGECKPDEGPAEMIKNLKTLGQPYEVREDVVEANRPMQVRLLLNDGVESGQIIYYRGKARCQAQADKTKQATNEELNRYK